MEKFNLSLAFSPFLSFIALDFNRLASLSTRAPKWIIPICITIKRLPLAANWDQMQFIGSTVWWLESVFLRVSVLKMAMFLTAILFGIFLHISFRLLFFFKLLIFLVCVFLLIMKTALEK